MASMHARYILDGASAKSGMVGAVFLGRDRLLERDVVVKQVSAYSEAVTEARALAAVAGHPSMLDVYDVYDHDQTGWLVMSRVVGKPLGRDERCRKRSRSAAVSFTLDLLRGLRHMHERGYLHTDVKPQNILVPDDHRLAALKLIDLGGAEKKNKQGRVVGKPRAGCQLYMPPEQFDANAVLDDTSDLYQAAGVCVYLLTGRPNIGDWPKKVGEGEAAEDASNAACRARHQEGLRAEIANGDLSKVLARALHPKRSRRFPSAQALINALRRFTAP